MSLIGRKSRPLARSDRTLRDDRLFIVACDDTYAPKQYFDFFKITRVHVHVVPTTDGTSSAPHVLERLEGFKIGEDDERWMLLDTDHCTEDSHIATFLEAIQVARQKGIKVALSRPCFELWLLLHHVDGSAVRHLKNARDTETALRNILGNYNKNKLEERHYPIDKLADALMHSKRLDGSVLGGDNPESPTSRVHNLWKAIISKALPSQLPAALRDLGPEFLR